MEVHSDGESNPHKEVIPGTVGVALTEGEESPQRWEQCPGAMNRENLPRGWEMGRWKQGLEGWPDRRATEEGTASWASSGMDVLPPKAKQRPRKPWSAGAG